MDASQIRNDELQPTKGEMINGLGMSSGLFHSTFMFLFWVQMSRKMKLLTPLHNLGKGALLPEINEQFLGLADMNRSDVVLAPPCQVPVILPVGQLINVGDQVQDMGEIMCGLYTEKLRHVI